jgi:pimeloyl-ACP methyl ester carboxylesterase
MKLAVVLLPGMDGTGDLFEPLVSALGPEVEAIVVRYPDEPLDYRAHEEVAWSALPKNRPYLVLGESFSGPIAVALAARQPPGLLGYVLSSSFVVRPSSVLAVLEPLLKFLSLHRVPMPVVQYFLMGRFASSELRAMYARALTRVSPGTLVTRLRAIARVDVRTMFSRVAVPGLYLRATEDRLVSRASARQFERLASRARVADIVGPHFLLQSNPVAAAQAIKEFAREVA